MDTKILPEFDQTKNLFKNRERGLIGINIYLYYIIILSLVHAFIISINLTLYN